MAITKATEIGRIEYVESVLSANGWSVEKIFNEKTYESKIFGFYNSESDPFFSIIARNNKSNN